MWFEIFKAAALANLIAGFSPAAEKCDEVACDPPAVTNGVTFHHRDKETDSSGATVREEPAQESETPMPGDSNGRDQRDQPLIERPPTE